MDAGMIGAIIIAGGTICAAIISKVWVVAKDADEKCMARQNNSIVNNEVEGIELLPSLQRKYRCKIKSEIISVKFCQERHRCYLQIETKKVVAGYLHDEMIRKTDLSFIVGGDGLDDLFFDPRRPSLENAQKFIDEFDEVSIANCTDLFCEFVIK